MTIAVNCVHLPIILMRIEMHFARFTVIVVSFHEDIGCPSFTDWL